MNLRNKESSLIELTFDQFLNKLTGNNKGGKDMPKQITIVMYHFVRDLKHSRYPKIKGITINEFKEQLSYIENHYQPQLRVFIKQCVKKRELWIRKAFKRRLRHCFFVETGKKLRYG